MHQIPIAELKAKFRYDPETGLFYLFESKQTGFDIRRPVGTTSNEYVMLAMGRIYIQAHRVAWALHYGYLPNEQIDHIDRDKKNNRISNLRLATPAQNSANTPLRGVIPAKGVCLSSPRGTYRAKLKVGGIAHYLGTFPTIDEAAHAYNKAAIQHHGEFAVLNPIGQDKGQP